jgi:hypothetical protein
VREGGSLNGLKPCSVIVDTRNVHGRGKDLFGVGRRPTAASIRKALGFYGLDAVEIFAGVATQTGKQPSATVRGFIDSNVEYAERLRRDGVTVLEGRLAEWPQGPGEAPKVDEKQVDVLLALQVAELVDRGQRGGGAARQIVVLSEDMDLMPAFEFAARRGVEVYAASTDTWHQRPQQTKWFLLHEDAAAALVEMPFYASTADIRSYAAAVAARALPVQSTRWKAFRDSGRPGDVTLYNGRGVGGLFRSPFPVRRGDKRDLYANEVVMGGRFPRVRLSSAVPVVDEVLPGFVLATVLRWVDLTSMKVRLPDGSSTNLTVSPGAALVGDEVVVHVQSTGRDASKSFVGPLTRWDPPGGWSGDRIQVVEVTGTSAAPNNLDAVTESGTAVLIRGARLKHAAAGSRVLVAPAGVEPQSGLLSVMPMTCCLP